MILIVPVRILFRLFTPHIVTATIVFFITLKREFEKKSGSSLYGGAKGNESTHHVLSSCAHLYIGVISLLYQTTNIAESFCRGGRMSHGNSAVPWRTALAVTIGPATTNIVVTLDRFNDLKVLLEAGEERSKWEYDVR